MVSNRIRTVVIVDDSRTIQALLDNAFSNRREFKVVGICSDAVNGAAMIRQMLPDVATIDLCMPYIDGSALLEAIEDIKSVCKIIVSDQTTQSHSLKNRLLAAGAATCISKSELAVDQAAFFRKILAAADSNNMHKTFSVADRSVETECLTTLVDSSAAEIAQAFPIPIDENRRIKAIDVKGLANAISECQPQRLSINRSLRATKKCSTLRRRSTYISKQ